MDFNQQQHNAGTIGLSGGIVIIKLKMLFDKRALKNVNAIYEVFCKRVFIYNNQVSTHFYIRFPLSISVNRVRVLSRGVRRWF